MLPNLIKTFRTNQINIDLKHKIKIPKSYQNLADRMKVQQSIALDKFYEQAWKRYVKVSPDAPIIHQLLEKRGEKIINDHVALRTFNLPGIDRKTLGNVFTKYGYMKSPETLQFSEKKLVADYYLHPNPLQPRVFISELIVEQMPNKMRRWIYDLTKDTRAELSAKQLCLSLFLHPSWNAVKYRDYQEFYPISEYASWTAAFGLQINHFTVSHHYLKSFNTLEGLNSLIKKNGIELNQEGGEIKGDLNSPLRQSSTISKLIPHYFADGIPGCYYEFANRSKIQKYHIFYEGFIAKNADNIFLSTRIAALL